MIKVTWTKKALKQLAKMSAAVQKRLPLAARLLYKWPDVPNIKALKGRSDYRLRVGDYRLLFTVNPAGEITVISITEVKKRDEHTYHS